MRITCNHKGVRIQARTGHYAGEDRPSKPDAQQAIDSAISTAFDAAEIGLRATVSTDPTYPQMEHFSLHIDANDLALPLQANQYVAQLYIATISYLANGDHDTGQRRGAAAQRAATIGEMAADN